MSTSRHLADNPTFVIAEAGVNHNGSLDLALQLVDVAADAGADAVKFQTFKAENGVTKSATKAEYQKQTTGSETSQYEMLKKLELDDAMHQALARHCVERDIEFMSTAFDPDGLSYLIDVIGVSRLKISSGEITNAALLFHAGRSGKPVILSTGMSTLDEVESALGVLAFGYMGGDMPPDAAGFEAAFASSAGMAALVENVSLLHCTTEYPTPFEDVNLRAMATLKNRFGLVAGYSDHSSGITVPVAAVALGARICEKHFTISRTLPGPDHAASLEPAELGRMIQSIREVEAALGSSDKVPTPSEYKNISVVRKSLVAATDIAAGELFNSINLGIKRPGEGRSPMSYWDVLGQPSGRAYSKDEYID